jgi:hypothetical protein
MKFPHAAGGEHSGPQGAAQSFDEISSIGHDVFSQTWNELMADPIAILSNQMQRIKRLSVS